MLSNRKTYSLVICLLFLFSMVAWASDTITFEDNWGNAGFNLMSQDAAAVEVVYSVPAVTLEDININGEMMQDLIISGVMLPNDAGAPNLPGTGRYIAIPQGSKAEVVVLDYRSTVLHNINVAPAFVIPRDTDKSPLKYLKNPNIYNTDANFPAEPVMMSKQTQIRGVDVVILGITPFQYNPVTKDLTVYQDIRVKVNFIGGNGHFGEDRLRSRWWDPVLAQNLLNFSSLPPLPKQPVLNLTDDTNVEYLIIIPDDPAFIAWADTLKNWRNQQGIRTGVTRLSEMGGNVYTSIKNYITNAYNTWTIPPVAVLILSDYQSSGDTYGITANTYSYSYTCVSDNFYADVNNNQLPDLAIGRICAQNNTQLQTMIGKMLTYERTPVTSPTFYDHPVTAGGWQTERWFILCTEVIWGYLHNVKGQNPVREYAIYSGTPGSSWSSNANTYMVVNHYGPSGLGYIPATPSYLTDWGANATRVNADINAGAWLVQHRDHGMETGWGEPNYTVNNLSALYNTQYPYVISANCLSGKFNWSGTCFVEAMHRSTYGAVGLLSASETSYSFVNDVFCWGVYDCMMPDFDPDYGSMWQEANMPAFGNASGKYYLQASSWPYNPTNKDETYYLFHHFGDTFMTLYSAVPQNLTVSHAASLPSGSSTFSVTANAGSYIGLSVNGQYIGSADGTGSPVNVTIVPQSPGATVRVTVTKANYFRYMADIPVSAGGPPSMQNNVTPINPPIVIPANGGSFQYTLNVTNVGSSTQSFDVWNKVRTAGNVYYDVWGPVNRSLPASANPTRILTQSIASTIPSGTLTFLSYIGYYPSTIADSGYFTITKSALADGGPFVSESNSYGSFLEEYMVNSSSIPLEFALQGASPNPFNPSTNISFSLATDGIVNLTVYDVSGRAVATLVDGYRQAGPQEVTFDGTGLASGVYVYQLTSGDQTASGKLVLL
ncbi:MAG: C25 family cysteine peptidase [bacterium]|nr:C25 family cysteine peptidase [bacterium]